MTNKPLVRKSIRNLKKAYDEKVREKRDLKSRIRNLERQMEILKFNNRLQAKRIKELTKNF